MIRMKPRRTARTAMTLIEVLVALAISSVVVAAIGSAVASGLDVWDAAQNYDAQRMETIFALEQLERDIRNAIPLYAVSFRGMSETMAFCGNLAGVEGSAPELGQIEYVFDGSDFVLERRARAFPFKLASSHTGEAQIERVQALMFRYGDRPSEETNGEVVWHDAWPPEEEARLPYAVRLTMKIEGKHQPFEIIRTIYLPRLGELLPEEEDDE